MNRIVEVRLFLANDTDWVVQVTKEFAPENGGGTQTFTQGGGNQIHRALDVARGMVTLTPANREFFFCIACHEQAVQAEGQICSCCNGGEE